MYSPTLRTLFIRAVTDNTFWCIFKNRILCFDLRLSEPESVFSCYNEQQVGLKRILHLFWQYSILFWNKSTYTPPSGHEPLPLSLPADIWSCLFAPQACGWCALCVKVHTWRNSLLLSLCQSRASHLTSDHPCIPYPTLFACDKKSFYWTPDGTLECCSSNDLRLCVCTAI